MQAATVRLYSATSVQLITPVYGYSRDMTRQDNTTALAMFSTAVQ
jgi:phosphoribosylpyrophosphate synthetase